MTTADIFRRVEAIRKVAAYDDETAHVMEDDLHQDVLAFIAQGHGASLHVQLAKASLATAEISFGRWCS